MIRTNAFTLLCMLIRVVAIFVGATFLVSLPGAFLALRGQPGWESISMPITITMVGALLVLAICWLFADKIARLALVRPQDQTFDSDIEPQVWLGLAISIMGAWFAFNGLKDFAYLLPRWLLVSRMTPGQLSLDNDLDQIIPDAIAIAAELMLATVFLLRGQGLSRMVYRLRYGRLPEVDG